ncbi:iron-sulfur cluster carrier protein ApbC [Saccharophagus sp. K07]|jgi:ATP-binding protein involved in chromosome partitioning|uniref:iron-sulfur cluster carrier protein ApbC n=1 Tax=Saccharophagus sp. K07 TaxID=2283636 RepID=UPI0016526EA7|nr:iron-sulfur cluster carrier protein ApbC [Saccharophagus sp. K07]MBC6904594.1 iron-sulfur cluster carrier protein ApbC [Saccharophagus sp. K07]
MASLFESVRERLQQVSLPHAAGLSLADALQKADSSGTSLSLQLEFGYPFTPDAVVVDQVQSLFRPSFERVELQTSWRVGQVATVNNQSVIPGVKNIIAVASGKGGVGKSTTAVNLALALARAGANVGMLDADIYGPSQALMLGVADKRPEMHSPNKMLPIRAHGLQMISMGNLVTEKTPVVWRGPMVSGALQQLLNQTHWQDVDYLIVDMPPGTGDIQLTLAQAVPVSGAVIVTTPQDIALADARKGIEMFRKVNIPVLGIVENMSLHICSNCGHEEAIFGTAGGDRLAAQYGVEMLGRLPLQMSICEQTDSGNPPVVAEPDSAVARNYCEIAAKVGALLWEKSLRGEAAPTISISDD